MRIKVLDRYLSGEFFLYLILGLTFVVIFLTLNTVLFQMLTFVIDKHVPLRSFLKILFYQMPQFAVTALPMATLFAALLSITRMSRDSEIDVLRTSGIGVARIMVPLILSGIVVAAGAWVTIERVVPLMNSRSANMWRKFQLSDVMSRPAANVFFKGKGSRTFFIKVVDPKANTINGITILDDQGRQHPRWITATDGLWQGRYFTLRNGIIHQVRDDGFVEFEMRFDSMRINVERQMQQIFGDQKTSQEMSLNELRQKISLFKKSGLDYRQYETDYHFKMAIPAANIICILVALPLSIRTGRSGMLAGIVTASALMAVYWVLTIVTTTLGYKGVFPPWAAAWAVNATFLIVGAILFVRTRK